MKTIEEKISKKENQLRKLKNEKELKDKTIAYEAVIDTYNNLITQDKSITKKLQKKSYIIEDEEFTDMQVEKIIRWIIE